MISLSRNTKHKTALMPIQLQWLQECATKYGFADVDETLRQLIYLANSEPSTNKRLIFRIKRCLHCHVGARASQHAKVDLVAQVHAFQMQWLQNVTEKCDIKSLEKSVRIICDYYQSRVKQAEQEGGGKGVVKERELFSVRREEDPRLAKALAAAAAAAAAMAAENTPPNDDTEASVAAAAAAAVSSNDTGRNGGTMGCDLRAWLKIPPHVPRRQLSRPFVVVRSEGGRHRMLRPEVRVGRKRKREDKRSSRSNGAKKQRKSVS